MKMGSTLPFLTGNATASENDLSLTVYGGLGNDRISMLDGDAAMGSAHALYGGEGADRKAALATTASSKTRTMGTWNARTVFSRT